MTIWRLISRQADGADAPSGERSAALPAAVDVPLGQSVILGRSASVADVALPHRTVGRRHVRLTAGADGLTVEFLGAGGGAWLNGERLTVGEARALRLGDRLHVGATAWEVAGAAGSLAGPAEAE